MQATFAPSLTELSNPSARSQPSIPRTASNDADRRRVKVELLLLVRSDRILTTFLSGESRKVLLAFSQCTGFLGSRSLEIHSEPQGPNNNTCHASSDILSNLPTALTREILNLLVVGGDLSVDLVASQHVV